MTGRRSPRHPELAEFLRAMRARLRPEDVGLPDVGRRRTPGLRRQEVAQLAAVSIDWYIRLEQGRVGTPGASVLDAVAGALRLSPSERRHLYLISRGETPVARHPAAAPVGDSLRVLLAGMPLVPAYVIDFRFDVLAYNTAATALFGAGFGAGDASNAARVLFLPHMREIQLDWVRVARETVGNLRANLGRHPDDVRLRELIAELRGQSPQFTTWWDDHTVKQRAHGRKNIRHPVVGELALCYDTLATLDESDQCLIAVTPADPAAEHALRRLMSGPGLHAVGT